MSKFSHIGFVVKNIEDSLSYWIDIRGYTLKSEIVTDEMIGVRCCLLSHESELQIELVSPIGNEKESILASRLARGGGLDHLAYLLPASQFSQVIDNPRLLSKRRLVFGPVNAKLFNSRVIFVLDMSGLLVEYIEETEN